MAIGAAMTLPACALLVAGAADIRRQRPSAAAGEARAAHGRADADAELVEHACRHAGGRRGGAHGVVAVGGAAAGARDGVHQQLPPRHADHQGIRLRGRPLRRRRRVGPDAAFGRRSAEDQRTRHCATAARWADARPRARARGEAARGVAGAHQGDVIARCAGRDDRQPEGAGAVAGFGLRVAMGGMRAKMPQFVESMYAVDPEDGRTWLHVFLRAPERLEAKAEDRADRPRPGDRRQSFSRAPGPAVTTCCWRT